MSGDLKLYGKIKKTNVIAFFIHKEIQGGYQNGILFQHVMITRKKSKIEPMKGIQFENGNLAKLLLMTENCI